MGSLLPRPTRGAVAPGPRAFLLRSFLSGGHHYLRVIEDLATDFGDLCSFSIGSSRVWCVFHPDDVERILVGAHRHLVKDISTKSLSEVLGQGLVTADGEVWRRHRKLVAPPFTRNRVREYADEIVRITTEHRDDPDRFDASRPHGEADRDVQRLFAELALDIVVRTIFGMRRTPPSARIGTVLESLLDAYAQRIGSWEQLLPMQVPTPASRAIRAGRREIDDIVYALIAQHEGDGDALLDRLVSARDDDGSSMDAAQLRDEVATLLLAGHETTALVLTYAAYALAHNPEAQAALHDELDQVLEGRAPTADDLPRLRVTDAIVRESMRLYPPVWSVGREVIEPFDLRGYRLEKGHQILMAQWICHRDARWFPEPESFRPARWLDPDAPPRPRFAYFPFGGGPRICVGNHFAMLEAVLALAVLAQRLHFHTNDHTRLELVPAVTLRPRDRLNLRIANRSTPFQAAPRTG